MHRVYPICDIGEETLACWGALKLPTSRTHTLREWDTARAVQDLAARQRRVKSRVDMADEESTSLDDLRPVLLVTTVDIGEGVTGRVEVRLGDDPEDAARAFCAANGLPESVVMPLALHLQSNLELGPASEQVCGAVGAPSRPEPATHSDSVEA